jgi:hypothetical protein
MRRSAQAQVSRVEIIPASPSPALTAVAARPARTHGPARFFYAGAASFLLLAVFFGFQQFYLHGGAFPNRPLTPPIRTLLVVHGTAMTAWVVLLLVQPLLVVNRKYRVHMTLGKIGAVLAACIFILGFKLTIAAARLAPPEVRLWNMPYKQFMAVPLISITLFAAFVTAGIVNRRKPGIHRPMMLLATLAAIPAAMARIDAITSLYRQTVWGAIFGPFFSTAVIGGLLLVSKWALTRKFDRYYAMGWAGLVITSAGVMRLATTGVWDQIAGFLLRH